VSARFPFVEIPTREHWAVGPNRGGIPWWILLPSMRVPGTRLTDYLALRRLASLQGDVTVATALQHGRLYRRLIEPLAIAALNTQPERALACLLGAVVRECG
jgi:hydroxysqualene dehydroxylase